MRILLALLALAGGIASARAQQPVPDPAMTALSQMIVEGQQREFAALRRAAAAEQRAAAAEAKLPKPDAPAPAQP